MKMWVIGNAAGSIGEEIEHKAKQLRTVLDEPWYKEVIGTGTNIDVRDWDLLDKFVAEEGPFDAVAYCAGIADLQWIADLHRGQVHNVFDVNVYGFMGVMRALTANQDHGRVCAVVSDAARHPMRGSIAYCASKAALEQAVRVAARELAPAWQVNGVSPCVVEGTRMTEWIDEAVPKIRGWSKEAARNYEEKMIPMHRRAFKYEVAEVVLNTLHGPSFLTGSIIMLTGGK